MGKGPRYVTSYREKYLAGREEAAVKLVRDMHDEQHPLHDLLPPTRGSSTTMTMTLRNENELSEPKPKPKTNRVKNSTLYAAVRLYNDTVPTA